MPSGLFTRRQHLQAVITNSWAGRPSSVDYLVVAGGGGGGDNPDTSNGNGGGGAGGLLQGTVAAPTTATTVTVGSGSGRFDAAGGDSVFGSITSKGGGSGARHNYFSGLPGGSGGGGSSGASYLSGGQGIFGQGNAGGTGITTNSGGGGGGAGSVGLNGITNIGGSGGAGIASDISGSRVLYAGGGGGGVLSGGTSGAGGIGGGGTGNGTAGVPNTGSGGGSAPNYGNAGTGGSGIVIISYPGTTQWYSGGTLSFAENRVVHTFYSSGTLTPIQPVEFADTTYQISRSLRFNSADSAYLNRTPGSASNRTTFTWSGWIKRAGFATYQMLFQAGNQSNISESFLYFVGDGLRFFDSNSGGTTAISAGTDMLLRDPAAWYHIVLSVDTTQSTDSNRVKIYVNGIDRTAAGQTWPTQNYQTAVNSTFVHRLGTRFAGIQYFDGYMTEVNFIDGLALTPQAFGFTNPNTGVWSPLRYTGSYGTNGFYLNFSDNSNNTASTLGKDNSGNTNNWTPNNFSVTAGAGNDSLVDSPTAYGFDTGVGGEVRGNYCLWNPLSTSRTLTNGNLYTEVNGGGGSNVPISATMAIPTTGKWYWEITAGGSAGGGNGGWDWGIVNITVPNFRLNNLIVVGTGGCYGVNGNDGNFRENNVTGITGYISGGITNGDVAQVAYDADNGKLWLGKNNTWGNDGSGNGDPAAGLRPAKTAASGMTGQFIPVFEYASDSGVVSATANFGQRPFAYSAPSGFKALCTQNLPTPTIGATTATQANKYFNTVTYTGAGVTQPVTVGFQPDFVWIKNRTLGANWHVLTDAVRGVQKEIYTNSTAAEGTLTTSGVNQFNTSGFQILGNTNDYNGSTSNYVAWNWKANGTGSTNTAGSITSTVSANTTAGFSIVTWTGNATQGATVGHGLGAVPALLIFKNRSVTATEWPVKTNQLSTNSYLFLNATNASASYSFFWSAEPTSSLIYLGSDNRTNGSGNSMVCYAFAPVAGYSAFGSYTGNGSTDGPFVYCGFRPAYVIIKQSAGVTTGADWRIFDNTRNTYNPETKILYTNLSDAEGDVGTILDFTSNGFKLRSTYNGLNNSGGTFIYMAFAETPFKYSRAR